MPGNDVSFLCMSFHVQTWTTDVEYTSMMYVFFSCIWSHDDKSSYTFTNHIKSFRRTIKFTSGIVTNRTISCMCSSARNMTLWKAYKQPTSSFTSCHPRLWARHCKIGIAYSQAPRLHCICDTDLSHHVQNLVIHLVFSGHGSKKVLNGDHFCSSRKQKI